VKSPRKPIKILLIALGSLVALLIVFILCVLEWPSILINSRTLAMVAHYSSRKQGIPQVQWKQVQIQTRHLGLFSNQVTFYFEDFCFKHLAYGHGCIEDLNSSFAYGIRRVIPGVIEIGPVKARAKEIFLKLPEKTAATKTVTVPPPSKSKGSSTLIADAKLNSVDVQVEHWTFALPNLQLAGSYALHVSPAKTPATGLALISEIAMTAKSHALQGALNSKTQITVRAENPVDRLYGPWKAQVDLHAVSPKLQAKLSSLALISAGQEHHIDYRIKNHYFSPLGTANIALSGWALPGQEVRGEVSGDFEPARSQKTNPPSILTLVQMNRLQLQGCHFHLTHPSHEKQDGKFDAGCLVNSQIVRYRLYGQEQPPIKLWRELGILFKVDVTIPGPAHSGTPISGQLAMEPRADESSPLQVGGQVASHFNVMPGELPVPRELRTNVDLIMAVPQFQKLVKTLSDTPLAVPAPLRTLDGQTQMSLRGDLTLNQGGRLRIDVGTHLNHPPDHLNATGGGNISIEALRTAFERPPRIPQVDAQLNIALTDIHLTLPKTSVSGPPSQVLPDPRIHTSVPNATSVVEQSTQHGKTANFRYLVRVTTPPNHPIEIASQFLHKPLTVGLDLHLRQGRPWIGYAEINGNKEPVGIPSSEMAGQTSESRTGPKLPFGFSELVSSFLTGMPFQGLANQPKTGEGIQPKREQAQTNSAIELRRRY
jgi:hypothetical protein